MPAHGVSKTQIIVRRIACARLLDVIPKQRPAQARTYKFKRSQATSRPKTSAQPEPSQPPVSCQAMTTRKASSPSTLNTRPKYCRLMPSKWPRKISGTSSGVVRSNSNSPLCRWCINAPHARAVTRNFKTRCITTARMAKLVHQLLPGIGVTARSATRHRPIINFREAVMPRPLRERNKSWNSSFSLGIIEVFLSLSVCIFGLCFSATKPFS